MKSRSMIFGRNIRFLRESKGLTQEQVEQKACLSLPQYNRTELGNTSIDLDRVALFCDVFGVSSDVLLRDVFQTSDIDEEKKPLLNAIAALNQSCSVSSLRLLLRITQDVFQHEYEKTSLSDSEL